MNPTTHASRFARIAAGITLALALTSATGADSGQQSLVMPKAYVQECATCHTAFPAGMLPAASWTRIMNGLDKHYGTDASLDAATLLQLGDWLQANAASGRRATAEPPQDRITLSDWFVREHRKVDATVWKLASVNSASNCAACHGGADQGRFNERELIFPPGLDARYRRAWRD